MTNSAARPLILIELNEINFDVVRQYLDADPGALPSLRRLIQGKSIRTSSETRYEELEPWIQWPSVHSGLPYSGHQVFRLGDMVSRDAIPQIFEQLEQAGASVGAISAMNAVNRLRRPAYFIPDPWTRTPSDPSWWSRRLTEAISQAVNDNAQARITLRNASVLLFGLVRYARPRNYLWYLKLALRSRGAPWRKALFLDLFLHDLHLRLFRSRRPAFSTLFVNAGAHIQHHYFFNAGPVRGAAGIRNPDWYIRPEEDPVAEMLGVYDRVIGDYLRLPETELLVATGLSQKPYDRVKIYYRLKEHGDFLTRLGIRYQTVLPRMTRDFLIEFESSEAALEAQRVLESAVVEDGERLFGDIDNRGSSLFVTLTYPHELNDSTQVRCGDICLPLKPHVAFVAIKNGMHQGEGFAFFSNGISRHAPAERSHVCSLYSSIIGHFGLGKRVDLATEANP